MSFAVDEPIITNSKGKGYESEKNGQKNLWLNSRQKQ
jgi:hypothetical protein